MAKKTKAATTLISSKVQNEASELIENNAFCWPGGGGGFTPGFGSFNPFGLPAGPGGFPGTEPVSSINTLYKNLRWYLVSNFRQVLNEVYIELGLVQTIVDLPVDDALRGGIEIKSKQLSEEQIEELQISLDRDRDLSIIGQASKWNRLFGGAGVIILTDQDPETELEIEKIGPDTPFELRAADMWELFWTQQNLETIEDMEHMDGIKCFNYRGEPLHKSRVLLMRGLEPPSFIRPRLRGWGFSIVEKLVRSINQYLKGTDLTFEVLDEFKLDVYKIKNLVNTLLSPTGMQKVAQRLQQANQNKNYNNAIVLDSEDDYDHKQLSFAGLAEASAGVRKQVASDMRMPLTKLFGGSESGGVGNNDQNDLENYNSMVESEVREKIKHPILRIVELKCQHLFSFIPDDLSITFKPLRVLSAEQEENVKTQKCNRLIQAKQAGLISTIEFRDSANKGGLFDVLLDTKIDLLNPNDPQIEEIVKEGTNPAQQTDEVGEGVDRTGKKPQLKPGKTPTMEKQNSFKPYTRMQRLARLMVSNSLDYDKAAYEVDGGDDWISSSHIPFLENPGNVDEALWAKAKEASEKAFGKIKWPFVTWFYKKRGGKFNE